MGVKGQTFSDIIADERKTEWHKVQNYEQRGWSRVVSREI